jgi:hypothetical protein
MPAAFNLLVIGRRLLPFPEVFGHMHGCFSAAVVAGSHGNRLIAKILIELALAAA